MKRNRNNYFLIFKIIAVILGGIVGAGFATGQEIYSFFGVFGIYGILGIFIATALISYTLYVVLSSIKKNNIKTYEDYIALIFKNNKFLIYLNKNLISIFLLFSFFIMELGFSSLLFQQYEIPKYIGMLIISFLSLIVFRGNIKSVEKVNIVLIPLLIVIIGFVAVNGLLKFNNQIVIEARGSILNSTLSAIIYASYNLILLIPLVISLEQKNIRNKDIKKSSIIIFSIILTLSILIFLLTMIFDISNIEIPLIYIANFISSTDVLLSALIVLIAIFTSVICIGFSFLKNISKNTKAYNRNAVIICVIGILFINFSFANTMRIVYSFLGILGIIQIFAILLAKFREN